MNESFINFEYYFYNNSAIENKSAHFNLSLNTYLLEEEYCNSTLGTEIDTPEWEVLTTFTTFIILSIVILGTIFGNILVILGVFTQRPLRIVQNFFIVSLAAADLAVAILVMPLNVAYSSFGKWLWGKSLCKIWLTCDIMSCTSSILNLCAIALDRYYAITDPINYAGKRTLKRVMAQIAGVWALSLVISSPPLAGWNDWPEEFTVDTPCQLTSERGYVIYSSLGSFFIPLVIMTIVYVKIFLAARSRLRKRTLTALITEPVIAKDTKEKNVIENDSDSGDSIKRYQRKAFMDIKKNFFMPLLLVQSDPKTVHKVETEMEAPMQTARCKSIRKNNSGSSMRSSNRKKRCEKPLLASVSSSGDVVNQFIEQKQKISVSKERRAARTLGIIMGVFVICWLPFFLMYITLSFCYWCCPSNRLINLITWLGYANSAVNPLIYTTFNMDFRKAFKNLLGFR